jgi:aldose sugar dehydrogenase
MSSRNETLRVAILVQCMTVCAVNAAQPSDGIQTERESIRVVTLASGLEHPWSLAFLPDGRLLVTERPGRLRIVSSTGDLSAPVDGMPAVFAKGHGGLLDVVPAPDFVTTREIYFSFAEPRNDGLSTTSVARATLHQDRVENVDVIFRQSPAVDSVGHFGSRLVFDRDGALFVSLGERAAKHFAVRAQDLETHFGKVVRLDRHGKAAAGNPFADVPGAQPEIWSYGHRNVQGAAIHPQTGELWITEHGPRGGDELNLIRRSANYGWPLVTHGVAYSGDRIGIGAERVGIEPPVRNWVPSIGTSGLAFYSGSRFSGWSGSLFVGGLYGVLLRLEIKNNEVVHEERLLADLGERIRDVRVGPDGLVYLLTDSANGQLLRLEPAADNNRSASHN